MDEVDMVDAVAEVDLDWIVGTIVKRFSPKRVVLFGSRARGEAAPDSDVDLFVEMDSDKRPVERAIEVDSVFGLRSWSMDLVVYTPAEVEKLRNVRGTLLSVIESEGKVLYERS
ncbi:MAG: nucleotidyltransferase domain-containing protein [Candidatus Sumerlaeota bacterium]|nr:nucleotidyltransferase domain-containing protein [Candidatus Sumerlaeota bacterium]